MTYNSFDNYIGREVFILSREESANDEICVFIHYEELLDKLKSFDVSTEVSDLMILHGMIAPASVLPSKLLGAKSYIIALDPYGTPGQGTIVEVSDDVSIEDMAEEIETVVVDQINVDHVTDIDTTYILYGYRLELCFSINEDNIDDITIQLVSSILSDIKSIAKTAKQDIPIIFNPKLDIDSERSKGAV